MKNKTYDQMLCSMFIVMMTLKLCGVIYWSWWWIFVPMWMPLAIAVAVFVMACVIYVTIRIIK